MNSETEIERLKALLQSLLSEEPVMWDEVHAVERDLKFLLGTGGLGEDKPYAFGESPAEQETPFQSHSPPAEPFQPVLSVQLAPSVELYSATKASRSICGT